MQGFFSGTFSLFALASIRINIIILQGPQYGLYLEPGLRLDRHLVLLT